jgi:hypothetical protein
MGSATIKLFLAHGDPKSLRIAEISNWSGKAIAAPRTELDKLLLRHELQNAGIYILTGTNPDTGHLTAYIGEAEALGDRLKQHRSRDFWVSAFFFLSKDENLTRAHIRYLEGRLIEGAKKIGRYELENAHSGSARLPESDREDMEVFLDKIHQLLPVLGSELLTPIAGPAVASRKTQELICQINSLVARGQRTPNGFVVFKGSQAVPKHRAQAPKYAPWAVRRRMQLIEDGVLIPRGIALVFTKDFEFTSPSAAAGVIRGGTAAGPLKWRTKDGRTLKEIEESIQ